MRVDGRFGIFGLLTAVGCGDSLLGGWAIEERIGSPPLPERAAWEVRWVGSSGLSVDCARPDAAVPEEALALLGAYQLPIPEMPTARFVEGDGFRWALGLPVLVWPDAPFPGVGDDLLELDAGVWGTSAPVGWLVVEGDGAAAGARLRADGAPLQTGWVEVLPWVVDGTGRLDGAIGAPVDDGLWAVALEWSDDEELDLWSGWSVGGVVATCEDP